MEAQRHIPVVILCGGLGTRLREETEYKPKPLVEIGGRPILWHIMKLYAHHGFKEFLLALGYKGDVIKRYFLDYYRLNGSMTINLWNGDALMHHKKAEDWVVHLHDTGCWVMVDPSKRCGSWKRPMTPPNLAERMDGSFKAWHSNLSAIMR